MKRVEVELTGTSPLLMHAFPLVPIEALEKKSVEEQAEYVSYRDPVTRHLYIPATALQRSLINGATYSKGKGRASLQKNVAACLAVGPVERLSLGVETYAIDSRPVVMPATRGRVLRHRPRLDTWKITCTLDYDENLLSVTQLRRVVDDSGLRVGMLDFRPEKKGPFGRFIVTSWRDADGR